MIEVSWISKSIRNFKSLIKQNPSIRSSIESTLINLSENPFAPSLKTHKLKGNLSNIWAFSINYKYRILFKFVKNNHNQDAILLIHIGDHDEVY